MKTTVEISDSLAEEVKAYTAREGVTFRSLVERGLIEVLRAGHAPAPLTLRDAGWDRIRDAAYTGRGS